MIHHLDLFLRADYEGDTICLIFIFSFLMLTFLLIEKSQLLLVSQNF